jgi:hypothetical protein
MITATKKEPMIMNASTTFIIVILTNGIPHKCLLLFIAHGKCAQTVTKD